MVIALGAKPPCGKSGLLDPRTDFVTLAAMVRKLGVLLSGVIGATLVAAIFGFLHDQVTFTISPEYYTLFKFPMFHLIPDPGAPLMELRLRAGLVGVLATWWVGAGAGIVLGLVALIQRDAAAMVRVLMRSALIVIGCAVLVAAGLGLQSASLSEMVRLWYPDGLTDRAAFDRVGWIHNGSYLGGALGVLVAILYGIAHRLRSRA